MPETLRDTLSEAYDRMDAEPATEAVPVPEAPPEPSSAAPEAPPATPSERARDGSGRFTSKPPEKAASSTPEPPAGKDAAQALAGGVPTVAPPAAPPEPKWKAPQSWKPAIREKWASIPPEVQEEIARREGEVPKALEQAAQARRFQEQVTEAVRPFEGLARAAGFQHPMQFALQGAQVLATMQQGTPAQRVALVASAIRDYGIDVQALAAALDNPQAAPTQQAPQQADPRALIREELQRYAQENNDRRAASEVEKFTASAEFANDLTIRRRMAALITAEAEAGIELSLDDAYNQVLMSHPEYRGIMEQRKAAEAAKANQAEAQRARAAAVGVRSSPAAVPAAQPKGLRAVLEAKYDEMDR